MTATETALRQALELLREAVPIGDGLIAINTFGMDWYLRACKAIDADTPQEAQAEPITDVEQAALYAHCEGTPHYNVLRRLYRSTRADTSAQALAVAAERERCAKLCEDNHLVSGGNGPNFAMGWELAIEITAKAIRREPATPGAAT